MRKEIQVAGVRIVAIGRPSDVEKAIGVIQGVGVCGVEPRDREVIQTEIDNKDLKADIMYRGNTVYGAKKIVKELDRMRKTDRIDKMTDRMYNFLYLHFDIAHYNKQGYIAYYNGEYRRMVNGIKGALLTCPMWMTDVQKIIKEHFGDPRKL